MAKKMAKEELLKPVYEWAKAAELQEWELRAMCRAAGWIADKMISETEFDQALTKFRNRSMGG